MNVRKFLAVVAGVFFVLRSVAGCNPADTRVRLELEYGDIDELDEVIVIVAGTPQDASPARDEILLLVPDTWAESPIEVSVVGRHEGMVVANQSATVTPELGAEVVLRIVLEPSQCAEGECTAECQDECSVGLGQCDEDGIPRTCGEGDGDSCREWVTADACAAGEVCSAGDCVPIGPFELRLSFVGDGNGFVESADATLSCSDGESECSAMYPASTTVTLIATPIAPAQFAGWAGTGVDCGAEPSCEIILADDLDIVATFVIDELPLAVTLAGSGEGVVTSDPEGIDCGPTCGGSYPNGATVALMATADAGSTFAGWSGCSSTSATCTVEMTEARNVVATFTRQTFAVSISVGEGGRVTSSPDGIDCGGDCIQAYDYGTEVTLIAAPAAGYRFSGWSIGDCSGVEACVVTMTQARSATATFVRVSELSLRLPGDGSTMEGGSVVSSPAGILCHSGSCSASFAHDASVRLDFVEEEGFTCTFGGWTGDCVGSGTTCFVTMDSDRSINADFACTRDAG